MKLELSLELLRVAEEATIASSKTMGVGNPHKWAGAAAEAMSKALDTVHRERRPDIKVRFH